MVWFWKILFLQIQTTSVFGGAFLLTFFPYYHNGVCQKYMTKVVRNDFSVLPPILSYWGIKAQQQLHNS